MLLCPWWQQHCLAYSNLLYTTYPFFQLSTTKGFVAGNLSYTEEDGTKVNCTCSATVCIIHSIYLCMISCTSCSSGNYMHLLHRPMLVANCSTVLQFWSSAICSPGIYPLDMFFALPSATGALQRKVYILCILGFISQCSVKWVFWIKDVWALWTYLISVTIDWLFAE